MPLLSKGNDVFISNLDFYLFHWVGSQSGVMKAKTQVSALPGDRLTVRPEARLRDSCVCLLISEMRVLGYSSHCVFQPCCRCFRGLDGSWRQRLWQSSLITPTPVPGLGWFKLKWALPWDSCMHFPRAYLSKIFLRYIKCQKNFLFFFFFPPGLTLPPSSKLHLCWGKPYMLSSGQTWWQRTCLSLPPPFLVIAIITRLHPGCLPGKCWIVDYLHRWL